MLFRAALFNVALLLRSRSAQTIDPTGVAAAAYAISMQQYTLGWAVGSALQASASALVASAYSSSPAAARTVADRLLVWGAAIGAAVCAAQVVLLPQVIPWFTPVVAVREALRMPSLLVALLQLVNGICFVSEGIAMGLSAWGELARATACSLVLFSAGVHASSVLGWGLCGLWASAIAFNVCLTLILGHFYLFCSPLSAARAKEA